MKHLQPFFVIRSDDLPRHDLLTGYFFDGADIYVDQPLKTTSFWKRKARLPEDLDGIYVAVEAGKNQIRMTTDFAGTIPLFLYETKGFWAISPSFKKLLDLAKARGDRLDIVPDVLQAWRISGYIGQFPRNFQTCIAQIRLVPSYCDLVGTDRSITMVPRKRKKSRSYASTMNEYRQVMGDRFRTIIENGGNLTLDITGGIDSRSILATALEAFDEAELRKFNRDGQLVLRTNRGNKIDLPIAQNLAQEIGLELSYEHIWKVNKPMPEDAAPPAEAVNDRSEPTLGPEGLLELWREQRIGRWAVLGTSRRHAPPRMFASSGVFGGNLKSPNPSEVTVEDGRKFLRKFKKHFDSVELYQTWRERIISDVKEAQTHTGGERLPFWPIFNREFLMRLHAGQPLGSHRLYPLASKYLNDAINHLDSAQLADLRVHHDLIAAGSKALYEADYDKQDKKPKKGFKPTSLAPSRRGKAGHFHGPAPDGTADSEFAQAMEDRGLYQFARQRALELSRKPEIRRLMGEKYCDEVLEIVSGFSKENRQGIPFYRISLLHGPHLAEMLLDLETASDRQDPNTAGS